MKFSVFSTILAIACVSSAGASSSGNLRATDFEDFEDQIAVALGKSKGDSCKLGKGACDKGLFCKVGDYSCSEEKHPSGKCVKKKGKNADCPFIIAKVCGCDGKTYDNKCLAYAAGVNVAKNEACNLPGNGGAKCSLNSNTCTKGLFCRVGNYACDQEYNPKGRCAPQPEQCTYEIHEVCGCDGRTYSNPCSAYAAGVNIAKNEACHAKSNLGEECSFNNPGFCGVNNFCKIQDYYCKYEHNPSGVCRKEPKATACPYNNEPVCGCDCQTYANKCTAHAAGMNIYANSKCPKSCVFP